MWGLGLRDFWVGAGGVGSVLLVPCHAGLGVGFSALGVECLGVEVVKLLLNWHSKYSYVGAFSRVPRDVGV